MRKLKQDPILAALREKAAEHGLDVARLVFEFDEFQPEKDWYIRDGFSSVYARLTKDKKEGGYSYVVEYPSHKDCEFVTLRTNSLDEMFRCLQFSIGLLADIRQSLEQII